MFIIKKQITICLLFLMVTLLHAELIVIPGDQPTIQEGINNSANGDTVVVNPGIYYENINFRGKSIVLTSRFYETNNLDYIATTIIDGSQPNNPDTASCVLFINDEGPETVLQGFTITGGKGTIWLDEHGAGRFREGGGILTALSSPIIRFNLIIKNEASDKTGITGAGGGGIRTGDGNPQILNNVITENNGRYGAGIVLNYTDAILRNNIICYNSGGQNYGGGALWINRIGVSGIIIENNTIIANETVGIYVWAGTPDLSNNIVWGDTSDSAVQIGFLMNRPTVKYSNIQGGWDGTGNINCNPGFCDSLFHLSATSDCIDAGDSAGICNDPEDPSSPGNALWPSLGDIRNDMGAYGGPGASILPDFKTPLVTQIGSQDNYMPDKIYLEQNYPNPFNPVTQIQYHLPKNAHVSLIVYNVCGEKIRELVNGFKPAGSYTVTFDGQGLASGVYYYRLTTKFGFTQTRKLILLR
jgi:hypothetical protein